MELKNKSVWQSISPEQYKEIFEYSDRYKNFLDKSKTEREATKFIIEEAEKRGYVSLEEALKRDIKSGDKIYLNNHNKSCVLFVIGKEELENGMNIVGSHIDCPRLDLKQRPLYEDSDLALFKTHYYGGVKKYQWPTIPLALHGVIITQDGEKKEIAIGEKADDPVFFINDLLPHLSQNQNTKKLSEGIEGEQLNVVVGHSTYGSDEKENPIKKLVLEHLNREFGMVEEDFIVSELEIVPASPARDVGFDRSLVAAHGHDDRVCSYANLEAIFEVENPNKTVVALFADKEEIGSVGNTGMHARFFENAVAELINKMGDYNDLKLRRALANSKVLSADVTAAIDPAFKEVMDEKNASKLGYGITMSKYTGSRGKGGSNDANAEFLHEIRKVFNENGIIWQTGELGKVDQGGGGTIAYILAESGAQVVDMGTGMLSMHAPIELVSKADAYMTYKAYEVFMKNI
ncbi:aminopeptidase [Peptoniphilus indolicus]|uniref:M18 family aminopeptidase n=2 Tax=Peptoniphilus indolicus TaxID=33030 RepID=G4D3X5_9FIRM|nr:aminopeptidase [Peptoniphilus indolicus]EGY79771.1 M18 family aminopeptidase [Peptoniphilus indolicus ATCC 29427]SUB75800.1 Probable M18 family aminopeptidase 1 [Peptoniphilus indolicus]